MRRSERISSHPEITKKWDIQLRMHFLASIHCSLLIWLHEDGESLVITVIIPTQFLLALPLAQIQRCNCLYTPTFNLSDKNLLLFETFILAANSRWRGRGRAVDPRGSLEVHRRDAKVCHIHFFSLFSVHYRGTQASKTFVQAILPTVDPRAGDNHDVTG
jgi:hypothetical protein